MLNIKEEQGLPDLHPYHPAFRCRGGKEEKKHSKHAIIWSKSEFAENAVL